ncbi:MULTISPECIES: hypothetical protein [unclassified Breznakia]|uniref:lipopolysaccharide biosynthesis protein n=1 Tax=unclassified Breznakia TaxID=2623764 RepID=UPI0024753859|nr:MULTISPECIES: hypothetical protein [unclassified Breznakia]MDH6367891.1 O-antigen/teichoic acid export membrane protein [Breznakia sp. PH1-1]MDH6404979.1 O-antigen/teichoic acid export membrane protein [Breznakia sp. PF1-11]MDH6412710.1 O-antigen/teichoic acid export membrane protein [Breznakia sp. PFB1-11]MDH6415054.1 O-antigen/teichoic acid export membrane protein [Breznakia sp. PFB1-14]MDH6417365.1 O-antigen/teichoic acid export membrane protein [Breznakia sp. PFB1-4]
MMTNKELSLKQNMLWNSVGSFTYLLCQWALTFLVIKLSSDLDDSSNLTLAISITNIFFNIATFNIRPYLVSDSNKQIKDQQYIVFRCFTIVLGFVLCVIYSLIFSYSGIQLACILLYMVYKLGEAAVDIMHAFEQRKNRMDIGGKSLFVRGILTIVSFTVGMIFFGSLIVGLLLIIFSNALFIALYDYRKVLKFASIEGLKEYVTFANIKDMFTKFVPVTIASFLSTISSTIPRQILVIVVSAEALGIYGPVASPAIIIQVAASYVFNPFITRFASLYNDGKYNEFKSLVIKVSFILIALSICGIVCGGLLAEFGLRLLYNAEIASYSYLFVPILIYTSLTAFIWYLWNVLIVMRKLKSLLFVNLTAFIFLLIISYPMIQIFTMNGVTFSLILYSLLALLMMSLLFTITLKRKMHE